MSDVEHGSRLTRVESEVETIRGELNSLNSQMSSFGSILQRIEQGITNDRQASRINPIALATVLITIISVLVGGSWLISGELARGDERSAYQMKMIDRVEQRQWEQRKVGVFGAASQIPPQQ